MRATLAMALALMLSSDACTWMSRSRAPSKGTMETVQGAPVAPDEDVRAQSAADERSMFRRKLESSKSTSEPWAAAAADVFREWGEVSSSRRSVGVRFSRMECYREGCIITAIYRDADSYEAVNRSLPQSTAFRAWPGSKYRSPPVAAEDGTLEADWILFRPAAP